MPLCASRPSSGHSSTRWRPICATGRFRPRHGAGRLKAAPSSRRSRSRTPRSDGRAIGRSRRRRSIPGSARSCAPSARRARSIGARRKARLNSSRPVSAGTIRPACIMADRGWALDDRPTGLFDHLREPDATLMLFGEHAAGHDAAFLRNSTAAWAGTPALSWDDAANGIWNSSATTTKPIPSAHHDDYFAWRTRFWNAGASYKFDEFTVLSQALTGDTVSRRRRDSPAPPISIPPICCWAGSAMTGASPVRGDLFRTKTRNTFGAIAGAQRKRRCVDRRRELAAARLGAADRRGSVGRQQARRAHGGRTWPAAKRRPDTTLAASLFRLKTADSHARQTLVRGQASSLPRLSDWQRSGLRVSRQI